MSDIEQKLIKELAEFADKKINKSALSRKFKVSRQTVLNVINKFKEIKTDDRN